MYSINADFNKVFKALGYKTRTDILLEIKKGGEGLTLSKLALKFKMKKETLRFHVQELKNARLILSRRKDKEVFLTYNASVLEKSLQKISQIF